jgi:DNA-binding response OmpR family regulator
MPQTLLLADDSVTIRRVIELTFADENMHVVSVSSGRDALARIEAGAPDIVLADAGMPDVSGYDIAAFVKGRPALRHIPVILLAGAFEPLDEVRARKSGSDGVLVKPFEPQMVVARVRELLSQARARAAAPVMRSAVAGIHAIPEPTARPPRRENQSSPDVIASGAMNATDPMFDESLDRLDAAFASGGTQTPSLDATAASDFANDLRALRSEQPGTASGSFDRQDFGDWDLPVRPSEQPGSHINALVGHEPEAAADVFMAPEPEPVVAPMPPPIALAPKPAPAPMPPAAPPQMQPPVYAAAPAHAAPAAAPPAAAAATTPLADAFSSLLAAEEGRPHAPIRGAIAGAMAGSAPLTDADMDLIVDRVIARLGGGVRGAVIDLAERLVKAEIDRLKAIR